MPVSCTLIDRWNETAEHLLGKELSENWYAANVKTCPGTIHPLNSTSPYVHLRLVNTLKDLSSSNSRTIMV